MISTLWTVDDATTAPLMADFYRGLRGGDAGDVRMWSAIENLRDDLLATWQPNAHPWGGPYYWVGFVHVGASQPGQVAAASGSP